MTPWHWQLSVFADDESLLFNQRLTREQAELLLRPSWGSTDVADGEIEVKNVFLSAAQGA